MDKSVIGMPFYFVEPTLSDSRISEYLHLINVQDESIIPLKSTATRREVPIAIPRDADQSFYFLLEGRPINLATMKFTTNTCTGYQCDRQKPYDLCTCVKPGMGDKLVYVMGIEYEVDRRLFNKNTMVTNFSSYNTMSVFFQSLIDYTNATHHAKESSVLKRRRSQIRKMIRYINSNGGWKLVGWCKKGMLQIDGEAEKVVNNEVNIHLSSVYPQDESVLEDPIFKEWQIRDDFDTPDALLTNLDDNPTRPAHPPSDDDDTHSRDYIPVSERAQPPALILTDNHRQNSPPSPSTQEHQSPQAEILSHSGSDEDAEKSEIVKNNDDEETESEDDTNATSRASIRYRGEFPRELAARLYVDELQSPSHN